MVVASCSCALKKRAKVVLNLPTSTSSTTTISSSPSERLAPGIESCHWPPKMGALMTVACNARHCKNTGSCAYVGNEGDVEDVGVAVEDGYRASSSKHNCMSMAV